MVMLNVSTLTQGLLMASIGIFFHFFFLSKYPFLLWVLLSFGLLGLNLKLLLGRPGFGYGALRITSPIPLFKTFELRSVNLSAASIVVKDKDNPKVFNLISVCVDN